MNLTLISAPDWLTADGETLCDLPGWKSLETRIRRLYQGNASVICVAPPDVTPDEDALHAVTRLAEAAGVAEAHLLAWSFAPQRVRRSTVGIALSSAPSLTSPAPPSTVRVRKVLIPRDVLDRNCRRAPLFFEQAEAQALAVRHLNGSFDVRLHDFTPGLPISPTPAEAKLEHRARRQPFDFVDYWAVDFTYEPNQSCFRHQWHAFRSRRDRRLPLQSEAGYRSVKPKSHCAAVKVIDVWGHETLVQVPLSRFPFRPEP